MSTEYRQFLRQAQQKAADDVHRRKILKAITSYETAVQAQKQQQFRDWQQARHLAARIKAYALAHLPELLEQFERRLSERGGEILWAEDASQARQQIMDLVRRHGVRKVVKSKSMTSEEIGLNALLENQGVEVWESDLGELIVQVAGEKPYHIVTPAMHKSKEEIARLFHERLGAPLTDDAETLTMVARRHLRNAFLTADMGITGANFIVADEGAIVMTENEGNGRLTMTCPPIHVVLVGIEKVIPRLTDLALFLPLLATSGTGQQVTCYNSIVRGPRTAAEPDGPERLYVILLDNGRSRIYGDPALHQTLRCIRCGACLNACPVFRTVGGHTYGVTYQGPIGAVISPHLWGFRSLAHLPFASSLCGACTDVCPVQIDLHHLLLENRRRAVQQHYDGALWRFGFRLWAWVMRDRRRLQRWRRPLRRLSILGRRLLGEIRARHVPTPAAESFAELWEKQKHDGA